MPKKHLSIPPELALSESLFSLFYEEIFKMMQRANITYEILDKLEDCLIPQIQEQPFKTLLVKRQIDVYKQLIRLKVIASDYANY